MVKWADLGTYYTYSTFERISDVFFMIKNLKKKKKDTLNVKKLFKFIYRLSKRNIMSIIK